MTQYCLSVSKEANNKDKPFGALKSYLPKAFVCLTYYLMIAKRHAYDAE